MSIMLKLYTGANPFADHPALRDIWPEPMAGVAEEAVTEHLQLLGKYEIGDIFLIVEDGQVIGITGYFPWDEKTSDLGLRWHGIVPEARGRGLSGQVLQMVAERAIERFPQARHMIELIPQVPYGKPLEAHFGKLGFESFGDPEFYDWCPGWAWQPHKITLEHLADLPQEERSARRVSKTL